MQIAILPSGMTCHQLEAPELKIDIDSNGTVRERCESTFQVPFGEFSALSALRTGVLRSVDTLLLTVLNYRSNWASGKTWRNSLRELSELTGISVWHIRDTLSGLMDDGWLSYISKGINLGSRYQLVHHNCDRDDVPTDKNGNPLKFAVPQGAGGILERMFRGDISWKSALIWIMLKLYSDWQTGITHAMSIDTLRKWCRMSPQTVCNCLKELTQAGLLKRLSKKHETGVYQLYPKPDGKPKARYRPKHEQASVRGVSRQMRCDGDWRFSFNELWRVNVETLEIQKRKSRRAGIWRRCSDYTLYHEMPKAIRNDFDLCVKLHYELKANLGVTDSAQGVTEGAQGVTDSAHLDSGAPPGDSGSRGS